MESILSDLQNKVSKQESFKAQSHRSCSLVDFLEIEVDQEDIQPQKVPPELLEKIQKLIQFW